jgi:hypothetical protein
VSRPSAQELSPECVAEVQAELAAVLESSTFSNSRRCRDFLECVVELTLTGNQEDLTERFLGVKLFGRAVDYETATDSIVRVRANDVRRRLMQFYSVSRPGTKVRIEMAAGRYTPEFHWLAIQPENIPDNIPNKIQATEEAFGDLADPRLVPSLPIAEGTSDPASPAFAEPPSARSRNRWKSYVGRHAGLLTGAVALIALIVLAGAVIFAVRASRLSNFDAFWQPVLDAPGQPVLNLPTTDTFQLTMNPERSLAPLNDLQPGQSLKLSLGDFLGFHDWHVSTPVLQATLSVALALDRKGKTPLVRIGTDLRRDELRGHPVIAIGSFSNPWTERNVSGLRFTFDRGVTDRESPRIRDAQNPQRSWSLPLIYPEPQTKDYAIVTRTFDPVTGEPFVSLAGLHSFGNQIAGEFVSQEASWDEIARRAPRGWKKMNVQILLEADVVGTTPGSPRILDVYFWKPS